MLQKMSDLLGNKMLATDGEIGRIDDVYFDDHFWAVRYLVAQTGSWLSMRRVLISPESLDKPDWASERVPVNLTQKQIQESPPMDTERPVSRQYEAELNYYFNWTPYWATLPPRAAGLLQLNPNQENISKIQEKEADDGATRLRGVREILGYHIHTENGDYGHVEDIIFDDEDWQIRYFLVDTRNWLPGGKKVLLALGWVEKIIWSESRVYVEIGREVLRNSPAFDEELLEKEA